MKILFTSDTHFSHENMAKWRGFKDIFDMDTYIIHQWNSVVSPEDIVYHLGDVFLGKKQKTYKEFIEPQLNGNIIYIKGNHDHGGKARHKHIILDIKGREIELVHNPRDMTGCCDYVIHGHIHSTQKDNRELTHQEVISFINDSTTKFFNANLELNEYKPVELHTIMKYFRGDKQ